MALKMSRIFDLILKFIVLPLEITLKYPIKPNIVLQFTKVL